MGEFKWVVCDINVADKNNPGEIHTGGVSKYGWGAVKGNSGASEESKGTNIESAHFKTASEAFALLTPIQRSELTVFQ